MCLFSFGKLFCDLLYMYHAKSVSVHILYLLSQMSVRINMVMLMLGDTAAEYSTC